MIKKKELLTMSKEKEKVFIQPAIGDSLGIQDPSTNELSSYSPDAIALEPIEAEKPISSFYTVIPRKVAKKESVPEIGNTQTLNVPKNNIILGDITQEVIDDIKEGFAIGANFKDIGLRIIYRVQKEDSLQSALGNLRNAIFAAQYGKELPKNVYYESTHALNAGLAARLEHSIANTGELDAVIYGFPISE